MSERRIFTHLRNAFSFAVEFLQEQKLQREIRILRRILLQPQPIYSASRNGNTARLFTAGHIPDLKGEVRKVLTKGWHEADLRSSQLCICAWLWRIGPLMRFLCDNKNIWDYLFSFFDFFSTNPRPAPPARAAQVYQCDLMERSISRVIARNPICASNGLNPVLPPRAENCSGLNPSVQ
jgi:hypothetical protein